VSGLHANTDRSHPQFSRRPHGELSWRAEIDALRQEEAARLLGKRLSREAVAARLGYADTRRYAYAEVVGGSGRRLAAQAQVGDGVEAGAAFAAEVARRVLAGGPAGASPVVIDASSPRCRLPGAG
jgi:hypothetical protein